MPMPQGIAVNPHLTLTKTTAQHCILLRPGGTFISPFFSIFVDHDRRKIAAA
jgi:hypothetical protein